MSDLLEADKIHPIEFAENCGTNTPDETLLAQVAYNIRRGLPQLQPHVPNDQTAVIVAGGPSLKYSEKKDLLDAIWAGGKVVAVNGAYQWCIDRNIKPSAVIMLDAREFNSRFVQRAVPGCRYILASQCHPKTFDICKDRDVTIWHACSAGEAEYEMLKAYYLDRTYPVQIGTTVSIRAISVLRMLGFQSMEVFGLDSCWLEDEHHAYEQEENNRDGRIPVWLRPKGADGLHRDDKATRFWCAPWHIKQADDFLTLIKERGNMFRLNVHGPGLLATMLRTGAELQMEVP